MSRLPEEVAPDLELGDVEIKGDGDPEEMLSHARERLRHLEARWKLIGPDDPQQKVVALEIVTVREVVKSLEEELRFR